VLQEEPCKIIIPKGELKDEIIIEEYEVQPEQLVL
jgi:hypothetical protein